MKKYLKGLFAFAIMLFPMMVNAESMTGDVPTYDEANNGSTLFSGVILK